MGRVCVGRGERREARHATTTCPTFPLIALAERSYRPALPSPSAGLQPPKPQPNPQPQRQEKQGARSIDGNGRKCGRGGKTRCRYCDSGSQVNARVDDGRITRDGVKKSVE